MEASLFKVEMHDGAIIHRLVSFEIGRDQRSKVLRQPIERAFEAWPLR